MSKKHRQLPKPPDTDAEWHTHGHVDPQWEKLFSPTFETAFDAITDECEMCGKYGGSERLNGHFMCSTCWMIWNS